MQVVQYKRSHSWIDRLVVCRSFVGIIAFGPRIIGFGPRIIGFGPSIIGFGPRIIGFGLRIIEFGIPESYIGV